MDRPKSKVIAAALSGPETDIILERTLRAAPEDVYDAFLDARHIDRWWGPDWCQTQTHHMDPRVGGVWHHTMTTDDGTTFPNYVRYLTLERPKRLVYETASSADGPPEFTTTATIAPHQGGTRLTLQMRFASKQARDATLEYGSIEGGYETLASLDAYLRGRA